MLNLIYYTCIVDIRMDRIQYFLYLLKQGLKKYYIDMILILIIPLIALRGFLFKSGYYFYADQGWPLSNYIYASGILSFNSLTLFSFSRLIIDWPYYIITLFTGSVMVTERAFIYYTFVLYLFFAYIFATMITSKFLQTKNKYEIIAVKFIIILFIFSNFVALNLINDGGSYSDNLNILFIAIILLAFISWKNMRMAFLISTILLTISILVEPDYTTFYIISIIVGSSIAGLINRDFLYRFKYAILTIISAVIPVAFAILGIVLTSSPGSSVTAVGAFRVYNYGTISFFSRNIKPLYPLILIGHLWSTIVYAPPNILLYGDKISSVKSLMSPSQLLLPNGFITYIWLFTVIMVPVISLISIFFRKTRKITFPVIILFILFYTMSLVHYIRPLFYLELYISAIPLIGGSIGTTLDLPGHAINVIASMYYILFSISLVNLMNMHFHVSRKSDMGKSKIKISIIKNYIWNSKNEKYFKNNKIQVFVVIFIIFIVIFSGWQAFDGTFYPARAPDAPYGNNVGNTGGYTPLNINSSVIHAYDFISSQKTNFNILWIGGPAFSNRVYESPHPEASTPNLNYITSNNLSVDFYYNLLYSGVKYVVISNQDIQKNSVDIFEYTFSNAGFKNFTDAQSFLRNNYGLKEIYDKYQVDIFEVNNFTSIYKSNLLLNYEGISVYEGAFSYLFKTLGYNVAVTDDNKDGLPVNFDNNSNGISIDTPKYLSTLVSATSSSYFNLSSGHMTYPRISENSTLPFGNFVTLNNTLLKGNNRSALIYIENSTMNNYQWIKFNFSKGLYLKGYTKVAALILIKNASSLNNKNTSIVVSIYPSLREYKASYGGKLYSSIPGIYGNSIFTINKNITSLNDIKIVTKGKIIMDAFYIGIMIYLAVLSYFLLDIYRKNKI